MPQLDKGPETKQPLPRLRPDLIISEQKQEGRTYHVLKDPVSMQYLRLARHEYFLTQMLDGKRNLEDLARLLQEKFSEAEFDAERAPREVLQFLQQLADKNFLLLPPHSVIALAAEHKRDKWKKLLQKIRRNIFYFRIRLFDPDRLLNILHPPLRFIWTRGFMAVSVLMILSGLLVVALNFDRLIADAQKDFFTLRNLALLWIAFVGVKIIHEFGHGLTVKNYGGECHEMGFLFLVFTPALYCDTTDAWMMPRKMQRIWISSAGIYVELIIASIAAWLWFMSNPETVFHQLMMMVMFLCSFSTIVFNANPLLKFDGYYMLSDALEIPNMQQKGYAYVMMRLRQLLYGERPESAQFSQIPMPTKYRGLFSIYAIGSYAYRFFILFTIFIFLSNLLAPFGLEVLAKALALMTLLGSMIVPIVMSGYYHFKARATKPDPEPLTRPVAVLSLLFLAFLAATCIPIPQNVSRSCVLKPRHGYVRAVAPGFVRDVLVRDGQAVREGELLARLENKELQAQEKQLKAELIAADVRIATALAADDPPALRLGHALREQVEASLQKTRRDLAALELRAPADGIVHAVNGPHLQDLRGHWLEPGRTFCQVAPTQPLRVVIPLNQREARLVRVDHPVTLRVYGAASRKFRGRVATPALALVKEVSDKGLAAKSGGDVPSQPDPARGVERPSESLYEAELELENPNRALRPGMTGRAKIHCGRTTTWALIADSFRSIVYFDLQL